MPIQKVKKRVRESERSLFLSVWLILVLGYGIWYFGTNREPIKRIAPAVLLSPEMGRFFTRAEVSDFTATQYELLLTVRSEYRRNLPDPQKSFRVGYRYMGNEGVLESGVATCVIKKAQSESILRLQNPNIVTARKIDLRLAH